MKPLAHCGFLGPVLAPVLAVVLATGCAPLGNSRPWDPDRPVLPLRLLEEEEAPLPARYVILLAGADGVTGSIVIDGPEGRVVLDEPGMLSLDSLARTGIAAPSALFSEALNFEPRAPAGFEIYYPSDGSEPTAESQTRLEEILQALSDWPAAEIELAGHGDRFGSVHHNDVLSRRRAEAIRDALVAAGARSDLVEVSWHGETKTAVPTADGIREPRNRRVEIRIR